MRNILLYFSVLLLIVSASCNRPHRANAAQKKRDLTMQDKHTWLKSYALCACIKYSFKEDTLIKNDLSFAVYHEISDYDDPEVYQRIDSLSKQASLNIKPSQIADYNNRKALLQGCIDYYESKRLDSIVKSYDSVLIQSHK